MNLEQLLDTFKNDSGFMSCVTHWQTTPASEGRYADFPPELDMRIARALNKRGIYRFYSHQREAIELGLRHKDLVVVTPTASGKTYCYNMPVLQTILQDPDARALYMFPTKALAADQINELNLFINDLEADIKAYTFDGDTPGPARSAVRKAGHIVVTNPDMLHSGILPNHTKWVKLFENLRYIVIDEIHAYRGMFGSNLANVIRRLRRICAFYGSNPTFICCSATIANPQELAMRLTGCKEMALVDNNGAPTGARHMIFINPPVVNAQLGIRRSALVQTRELASQLVQNDIQTILFARARLTVEVLVAYLKRLVGEPAGGSNRVHGYRGGYLPTQRRAIERGLRSGDITAVVSTNALELGIDIGNLECCVLCGYPGTIASTWQRIGRAGRRKTTSAAFMVANSSALDQYIIRHPEYFFNQSPENALINPDNLYILMNHIKCAAYELPFAAGETYADVASTPDMLAYLCEENILHPVGSRYYWQAEEFPASEISLRSAGDENFLIVDITRPENHQVIGEMDRFTVPMLLHEKAIYLQEGQQYQVEKLDFEEKKAFVRQVDVDYYTDADLNTSLRVLDIAEEKSNMAVGDVLVTSIVTMFKKMKLDTQENLGWGPVDLPELQMHTTACWYTLNEELVKGFSKDEAQGACNGIANLLHRIAPLYLMCAPWDLHVMYHVRDPFTGKPTLFFYDTIPGGMGLAEKVYDILPALLQRALEWIQECPCESGCPSCVGPALQVGENGKQTALEILRRLITDM